MVYFSIDLIITICHKIKYLYYWKNVIDRKEYNIKKVLKIRYILLLVIISIPVFFYTRYLSLDTYKWDINNDILTLGEKQYKAESANNSVDLKLKNRIGKIQGEDLSFMV